MGVCKSSAGLRFSDAPRVFELELGLCTLSGLDESDKLKVLKIPLMSLRSVLLLSKSAVVRSEVNSLIESKSGGAPSLFGNHHDDRSTIH